MSWTDAYGNRRGDDEEYNPERDTRDALDRQRHIGHIRNTNKAASACPVKCPKCHAIPDVACHTPSGRFLDRFHKSRRTAFIQSRLR
jgi:hypothetical protein